MRLLDKMIIKGDGIDSLVPGSKPHYILGKDCTFISQWSAGAHCP